MNTGTEKIKTSIDAEITDSNTKMYTVSVKVTEAETGAPVLKGKVIITSKNGKLVGSGKISRDGTIIITPSISRKDYLLTVTYEGTSKKYAESKTKIDFKKEYLFYKTSFYLWTGIVGIIIVMLYSIALNSYIVNTSPAEVVSFTQKFLPYINTEPMTSSILMNMGYIPLLLRIMVWILIISFIVAGVYATQFNINLHNIIRKNVTNHRLFQNFFIYIVEILMFITIGMVMIEYTV